MNIERQLVTFRQNLKHCIHFYYLFGRTYGSFCCASFINAVVNQNKSRYIFKLTMLCKNGK